MEKAALRDLIKGCLINEKKHQKELYKAFYGFACSIALRYAGGRQEASVIMNNGFSAAFTCLRDYKELRLLKNGCAILWCRRPSNIFWIKSSFMRWYLDQKQTI